MRPRFAVLASVLTALGAVATPGLVSAAPTHTRGITINAAPNPVLAGQGVLIYGQLNANAVAGQTVVLYRHIVGSHHGFTRAVTTTTDAHGFYEFKRAENAIFTNRSWFVKADVAGVRSRVIYERVSPLVSLNVAPGPQDTNHQVLFFGHVDPGHAFERVFLQQQVGSSDDWRTLKSGVLAANSDYAISYRWRTPGERDVRVVFRADGRNARGESDPVTVTIEQAQRRGFTITSSPQVIDEGQQVTISGVLQNAGAQTPEPNTLVTLYASTSTHRHAMALADTTTKADGSYSFTATPTETTVYFVRETLAPHRRTAPLYEGVRDVVTLVASSSTSTVGGVVTFSGTVTPDKAGHVIYLQRLGDDGDWHTVERNNVEAGSTFHFAWVFTESGIAKFRARITSDRLNAGAHSAPVAIAVS